jgi:Ni,Fe-hydrogenase III large subunit
MKNKIDVVDQQLQVLAERVEELSLKSHAEEEAKNAFNEDNITLEEELYNGADELDRGGIRLDKIIENNDLLSQVAEELEMVRLKKKQRKLSKNKTKGKILTSRQNSNNVKSPVNKSAVNLSSYRTA